MKPEELDELFRHGLAGQQAPPRPGTWASIQQRMQAEAGAADAADADELPAFLRRPTAGTAAEARLVPLMTASRGGAPLQSGAAPSLVARVAAAWWHRPALRAAAAVVLLVGGGALLVRTDADEAADTATVALTDLPATALAPAEAPRSARPRPERALGSPAALPAALASATTASEAPTEAPCEPTPNPARPHRSQPATGYAFVGQGITDAVISEHLTCADHRCGTCDRIEHKIGPARFRSLRAEAAAQVVARLKTPHRSAPAVPAGGARPDSQAVALAPRQQPAATSSGLTVGEAADASLAEAPAAHGFVSVPREEINVPADDDDAIELDGGAIGQFVTRATGRPARISSPNALLRLGAGRVRALLDRADNTPDGQITIQTNIVGKQVRKTISL